MPAASVNYPKRSRGLSPRPIQPVATLDVASMISLNATVALFIDMVSYKLTIKTNVSVRVQRPANSISMTDNTPHSWPLRIVCMQYSPSQQENCSKLHVISMEKYLVKILYLA